MRYRKLSKEKIELLLQGLYTGRSYKAIAEDLDISINTVQRYYAENKTAVDNRRQEIAEEAQSRLSGLADIATDTLADLLIKGNDRIKSDLVKFILQHTSPKDVKSALDIIRNIIDEASSDPQ